MQLSPEAWPVVVDNGFSGAKLTPHDRVLPGTRLRVARYRVVAGDKLIEVKALAKASEGAGSLLRELIVPVGVKLEPDDFVYRDTIKRRHLVVYPPEVDPDLHPAWRDNADKIAASIESEIQKHFKDPLDECL